MALIGRRDGWKALRRQVMKLTYKQEHKINCEPFYLFLRSNDAISYWF